MRAAWIVAGNAPVSEESLEVLRDELIRAFGPESHVQIGGYSGPMELREAGQVIPILTVIFLGIAAAAEVVSAAVSAWRRSGKAPPKRVVRVQVFEYDEAGTLRREWIEETEEGE